ncbi:rhodanese-like domain-containing protein [Gilvimarinus polysaccharolyticus]|uniref:rhodanese-like domain-containing protein n=1 Tax=Gilvimarinus polysaccharolyticus TaxID=863921 RepID=UPI000673A5A6|nr:rhodanese-like domain-containing protein [Gilvimarinus polysaccharolyticus]
MVFYQRGVPALIMAALLMISFASIAASETVWIDVRTADEYAEAHLPVAVNISHEIIVDNIAQYAPDKNTQIVLYCRSGRRADAAKTALEQLGYHRVVNAVDLDGAADLYQRQSVGTQ